LHGSNGVTVQVREIVANLREVLDGVLQAQVTEEFEVDKLKKTDVKFSKGAHNFVINVERKSLVELVRSQPCNWDSHYLNAVVDTLNREERLSEVLGHCAVEHEVSVQDAALLQILLVHFQSLMLGKLSEE